MANAPAGSARPAQAASHSRGRRHRKRAGDTSTSGAGLKNYCNSPKPAQSPRFPHRRNPPLALCHFPFPNILGGGSRVPRGPWGQTAPGRNLHPARRCRQGAPLSPAGERGGPPNLMSPRHTVRCVLTVCGTVYGTESGTADAATAPPSRAPAPRAPRSHRKAPALPPHVPKADRPKRGSRWADGVARSGSPAPPSRPR